MIPKVSVLMSVYNDEKYLNEAIESVLNQSFTDFEFIIIDDASTDNSPKIIQSYNDSRIKHFTNEVNLGLTKSLNIGLDKCKGQFVARIDSNDVCLTDRLEIQLDYMLSNPDVKVCGSWFKYFGDVWFKTIIKPPTKHNDIISGLIFNSCIAHPTAMLDLDFLRLNGIKYNESYRTAQDYELWHTLIFKIKFANIDKALVNYRYLKTGISGKNRINNQQVSADKIRRSILQKFNVKFTEAELSIHNSLSNNNIYSDKVDLKEIKNWLKKLKSHFEINYSQFKIEGPISMYWKIACQSLGLGSRAFKEFYLGSKEMGLINNYKFWDWLDFLIRMFKITKF